ncbi:hypothetical protein [Rhodococcus qingshengii]|uniref:hypothetical protein n=1 Tax=Rhodococcus qingshengii TaxID=334542 RepID=UPI0015D4B324|nr:hypothetical protein [Rhodococcus qingshengii]
MSSRVKASIPAAVLGIVARVVFSVPSSRYSMSSHWWLAVIAQSIPARARIVVG